RAHDRAEDTLAGAAQEAREALLLVGGAGLDEDERHTRAARGAGGGEGRRRERVVGDDDVGTEADDAEGARLPLLRAPGLRDRPRRIAERAEHVATAEQLA